MNGLHCFDVDPSVFLSCLIRQSATTRVGMAEVGELMEVRGYVLISWGLCLFICPGSVWGSRLALVHYSHHKFLAHSLIQPTTRTPDNSRILKIDDFEVRVRT